MRLVKKMSGFRDKWLYYRACKRLYNVAVKKLADAETGISVSVNTAHLDGDYKWPKSSGCIRHLVIDYGPGFDSSKVGVDNHSVSYCDDYDMCRNATCRWYRHYTEYSRAFNCMLNAKERLINAKKDLFTHKK